MYVCLYVCMCVQDGDAELERIAAARAAEVSGAPLAPGSVPVADTATAVSGAVRAFVGRVSGYQGVDDGYVAHRLCVWYA